MNWPGWNPHLWVGVWKPLHLRYRGMNPFQWWYMLVFSFFWPMYYLSFELWLPIIPWHLQTFLNHSATRPFFYVETSDCSWNHFDSRNTKLWRGSKMDCFCLYLPYKHQMPEMDIPTERLSDSRQCWKIIYEAKWV